MLDHFIYAKTEKTTIEANEAEIISFAKPICPTRALKYIGPIPLIYVSTLHIRLSKQALRPVLIYSSI